MSNKAAFRFICLVTAAMRERTKGLTDRYLCRAVLTAEGMVDDNHRSQRVSPSCPLVDFQREQHANNPGG